MRLKNVLLVVSDIERSKQFYQELFGLRVLRDFGENVILTEGLVLQEQKSWERLIEADIAIGNTSELFFEEHNFDAFLDHLENYCRGPYEQKLLNEVCRPVIEQMKDALRMQAFNCKIDLPNGMFCLFRVNSWEKRTVMLQDPDGHLIEVAEA